MFHIALLEPEIPANTGSIGRTCVATQTPLHLIGKLGFSLDDKYLKRAGLDYWKDVDLHLHESWQHFQQFCETQFPKSRLIMLSKKAQHIYTDFTFCDGDFLIFGKETLGLPDDLIDGKYPTLRIPTPGKVRSLNLSVASGIILYEAIRQTAQIKS